MRRKIFVCVSEDWFALSHFRPLIAMLTTLADDVCVVTRCSGKEGDIAALGARVVNFDYRRAGMNLHQDLGSAVGLARLMRAERPHTVHLVAMKPAVIGSLAAQLARVKSVVIHMTGLGHLAISSKRKVVAARKLAFHLISGALRSQKSHLLAENAEDLDFMERNGLRHGGRVAILGGAGVDPDVFAAMPQTGNEPLKVASVGRMIHSKGLDVLVAAQQLLSSRGVIVDLDLYGRLDDGNPEMLSLAEIEKWTAFPNISWHGYADDVVGIWRQSDIAVLPARSREGMPRALLEAAACARPLVVSDVPGNRSFVRDGIEGLIVPPEDSDALADALIRLVNDPALRMRLGTAARQRVLDGFTEQHVIDAIRDVYLRIGSEDALQ